MKRIIVWSGGGVKGMIQSQIALEIERRLKRPLCQIADLHIGTSVGGIMAGLFSSGRMAAAEVQNDMMLNIPRMFKRHFGWPKYRRAPFNELVDSRLGPGFTMSQCRTKCIITSVNMCDGRTHYFKSWEDKDGALPLLEAMNRSYAAMIYFGQMVDRKNKAVWTDGGVGIDNTPINAAFVEMVRQEWHRHSQGVFILSIGTGSARYSMPFKRAARRWLRNLRGALWFVDPADGGLARNQAKIERVAMASNICQALKRVHFQHIDCTLPAKMDKIDGVEYMKDYAAIGQRLAQQIDYSKLV